MSLDTLIDGAQLETDLTSIANAIRAKSGGTEQLAFPAGFVSEIGSISAGSASYDQIDVEVYSKTLTTSLAAVGPTFTITQPGKYGITFTYLKQTNTSNKITIAINGTTVVGNSNVYGNVVQYVIANMAAGDTISFKAKADATTAVKFQGFILQYGGATT